MTKVTRHLFALLLIVLLTGCVHRFCNGKNYEEIPPMLQLITNNAQRAVEEGYFTQGEEAVLEYIREKNANAYNWFQEREYQIRVGQVDGYAVVTVCDEGKPVFEDTFCEAGRPDKDHRGNASQESCEITMTPKEVQMICE